MAEPAPTDAELAEFEEWLGPDPTIDELDGWLDTLHGSDWRMALRATMALEDAQARIKALEDALARLRLWRDETIPTLRKVKKRLLARSAEVVELRAKLGEN
jgi:hypothetical protein